MEKSKKKIEFDKGMTFIPLASLVAVITFGIVNNEGLSEFALVGKTWVLKYFGSWISFVMLGIVIILIVLVLSRAGNIRLGGKDAKPEFSTLKWFAMTLCSTIGVGIIFWGVAEPITFFTNPPTGLYGIEPNTPEAGVWALSQTFIHWGLPYSIFALFGLCTAYGIYNKGLPFRCSSSLYPILGDKVTGKVGYTYDVLCIITYIIGTCPSISFAVTQLAAGLEYQYGIPNNFTTYAVIMAVMTLTFSLGAYGGIRKFISKISDLNFYIFVVLMIYVFLLGNGVFIMNIGTDALGDFVSRAIPDLLKVDSFGLSDGWQGGWTLFYWFWWISTAPVLVMFMVRISRGHTIREFIAVVLGGGGLFSIVWFVIFGGSAIFKQYTGAADIMADINELGTESALFSFISNFPLSDITIPIFIICCFISFVTLAQAFCHCVATMTSKMTIEESVTQEPPGALKIIWGVLLGALALVLLATGSASAVQGAGVLAGLPVSFVAVVLIVACIKEFLIKKKEDEIKDAVPDRIEIDSNGDN